MQLQLEWAWFTCFQSRNMCYSLLSSIPGFLNKGSKEERAWDRGWEQCQHSSITTADKPWSSNEFLSNIKINLYFWSGMDVWLLYTLNPPCLCLSASCLRGGGVEWVPFWRINNVLFLLYILVFKILLWSVGFGLINSYFLREVKN